MHENDLHLDGLDFSDNSPGDDSFHGEL